MSVMSIIAEILTEPAESLSESQQSRKPQTLDSRAKSQESQKSQPATVKTLKITPSPSCTDCKHTEIIPVVGGGCVYKTGDIYQDIWTLIETLDECPRGYWN